MVIMYGNMKSSELWDLAEAILSCYPELDFRGLTWGECAEEIKRYGRSHHNKDHVLALRDIEYQWNRLEGVNA